MSEQNSSAMGKPNQNRKSNDKTLAKKVVEANSKIDTEFEESKKKLQDAVDKKAKRQADELLTIMQDVPRKVLEQLGVNIDTENNPEFFRNSLDEIIDSIQ